MLKALAITAAFFVSGFSYAEDPGAALLNRVTFYAGYGPDGVEIIGEGDLRTVQPFMAPLLGVSYSRSVFDNWSVTGQVLGGVSLFSRTFISSVGIGYDF